MLHIDHYHLYNAKFDFQYVILLIVNIYIKLHITKGK